MLKAFIKDAPFGVSVLFIILAIGFVYIAAPIFGNNALIVRSGSMEPAVAVGDLIITRIHKNLAYKIGDIISFKNQEKIVSHRIIGLENQNGRIFYKTKGDANKNEDQGLVAESSIIGKAYFRLPYLGRLIAFTKTSAGFSLAVIFPALLVIAFEIQNIFKEIKKQKTIHPETQKQPDYPMVTPIIEVVNFTGFSNRHKLGFRMPSLKIILPILASTLLVYSSFAFFSDTETSTSNIFSAAESFGPGPGDIVVNEIYYDVCTPASTCGNDPQNEWVELYNNTSSSVNLKNWTITDGEEIETITTVDTFIPANGFALISSEDTTWNFHAEPAGVLKISIGEIIGNGFNNDGDSVVIKDNLGTTIDAVSYGDDTSGLNPAVPDVAAGHSIERNPDGVDTNTNSDFVDRVTPTPGS